MKKLILLLTIVLLQSISTVSVSAQSPITYQKAKNFSLNDLRKDRIDWVYKVIDGKLYKRQYNFSQNIWLGDWVPC